MSGSYYLQWAQRKRMERNDATKMRVYLVLLCVGKLCRKRGEDWHPAAGGQGGWLLSI